MVWLNDSTALSLELIFPEWRKTESSRALQKLYIVIQGGLTENYVDVNRKGGRVCVCVCKMNKDGTSALCCGQIAALCMLRHAFFSGAS